MKKIKLSDIFSLYDLAIIKDTNGDYYAKDNADFLHSLKTWTYAGNNLLSVIDRIPDSLIESEIDDIFDGYLSDETIRKVLNGRDVPETAEEAVKFLEAVKEYTDEDVEDKLNLLRAIADPKKYVEDDIKQQFITKEDYEKYPDFRFNFTDIGQGVGYKADPSGYNWKDIPDNAILYIPECYAGTWGCKASYVYTKSDLEKCINDRVMDDEHFINAETMYDELSWEMPEDFLDGLDFEYKTDTYEITLD
jgi:hypothetical protein